MLEHIERLPSVALHHMIKEARGAIEAGKAGLYHDEMHACATELHQRKRRLVCREKEYQNTLANVFLILKEAGYDSYEIVDDLRDLVNDSQRPATDAADAEYERSCRPRLEGQREFGGRG